MHAIITENLAMRKVCTKFVPKFLTDDQKQRRMAVCEDLLRGIQEDAGFLANVVSGEESPFVEYDAEAKH